MTRSTLIRSVLIIAVAGLAASSGAAPAAGQEDFLRGLDALQNQQWRDAAQAFSAAVQADDENAEYHTALAIASMLSQDLQTAKTEFDRALRLNPNDVTAQRWAAGYYRMIGNANAAARIRPPSDYPGTVQEAAENAGRAQRASPQQQQAAWAKLCAFGVAYARDVKQSHPALAGASFDRAKQEFDQRNIDQAIADLQIVLNANPDDANALYWYARCSLAKGQLYGAREQLTRVLTVATNFGPAYAVRSVVEARLGSVDRAKADFDLAKKLDAKAASEVKKDYDAAVADATADAALEPNKQFDALAETSQTTDDIDALVPTARSLLRAENNHRHRWDEIYQDRLRVLEDDVRGSSKDIAKLMALGRFLYIESDIPGEQICPGGPFRPFRFGNIHTREQEISRADETFDKVLAIDPQNVDAICWKAAIRLENNRWGEGEALVNQALSISTDSPQLLELLTRVLDNAAATKSYQAQDLRSPRSWTQFGVTYDIIYTHYPTSDELDRADRLAQQANQLWTRAEQTLTAAVQKLAGTADGFYYDGLLQSRHDDQQKALEDFQKAAQIDPSSNRNRQAIIRTLNKLGRSDEAVAEKEKWTLERQTTITLGLARTWDNIYRTAWKSARATLHAAQEIDPSDPRIAAYDACIAKETKDPKTAVRWLTVALAQDKARLALGGFDLSPDATAPLPPDAIAGTLLFNLHLAARLGELNETQKNLAALGRNIALERRVPPDRRELTMPNAVLPDPEDPGAATARTAANLFAWSHVDAGFVLLDQNKFTDAAAQFVEVAKWPNAASFSDANALAGNELACLRWAREDPDRSQRDKWLSLARTRKLADDRNRADMIQLMSANDHRPRRADQVWQPLSDLEYWQEVLGNSR